MKQNKIVNCTILIISHERPDFLKKTYDFYIKYFQNIIILDSSRKKNFLFKNNDNYYHCSKLNIIQKVALGLKNSKTKFTIISPDDDYLFPGAIVKGLSFLNKNKDYISVSGKYFWFERLGIFKKYTLMYKEAYNDFKDNSPIDRLKKVCTQPLSQMTYNLFRTKEIYSCISSFKNLNQASFLEDVLILSPPLLGKHKFLNINWMLRDGAVNTSYLNTDNQTELFNLKSSELKKNKKKKYDTNKIMNNFINLYMRFIKLKKIKLKKDTIKILINSFYSNSRHPRRSIVSNNVLMQLIKVFYKFFNYNMFYYRYYKYFTNEEKKYLKTIFKD